MYAHVNCILMLGNLFFVIVCNAVFLGKRNSRQNKLSHDISGKEVVDTFCDMWVAIDIYDLHVVDCIYNNGGSEVIPDLLMAHASYNTLNYT